VIVTTLLVNTTLVFTVKPGKTVTHKKKPRKLVLDPASTTVAQVQDRMRVVIKEGSSVFCPCCTQLVALSDQSVSSMMAKVLIILHRHFLTNPEWLHVPTHLTEANKLGAAVRGGDWAKLRYWGLLEVKPEKRADGSKRAGFYRMPEKGHQFARGEIQVPKTVRLFHNKFMGFGEGLVGVKDCLGEEFDYGQLMAGNYGAFIV